MDMQIKHLTVVACALVALLGCVPLVAAQTTTSSVADETRDANLRAYATLLRSDIRAQKAAVISEVMQFTEAEDAKFWPVYREYEAALTKLNDERITLIKDYADKFVGLTDDDANRLAVTALGLEAKRHALKVEYYDRFKTALSVKTAARFLQVENQILLLLDLQIASALPLAPR